MQLECICAGGALLVAQQRIMFAAKDILAQTQHDLDLHKEMSQAHDAIVCSVGCLTDLANLVQTIGKFAVCT